MWFASKKLDAPTEIIKLRIVEQRKLRAIASSGRMAKSSLEDSVESAKDKGVVTIFFINASFK